MHKIWGVILMSGHHPKMGFVNQNNLCGDLLVGHVSWAMVFDSCGILRFLRFPGCAPWPGRRESPRCFNLFLIKSFRSMNEIIFIEPWHFGQVEGATS
ncbi:MAG: hypothetical protein JRI87_11055 [Deltaproteobacteria bacterium]|nr:hypothetical protein [Deltaproteobacteria bacterium]